MEVKEREFFELKNGDFCYVISIFVEGINKPTKCKLRVVKSCKGKACNKGNIGKPYTYQYILKYSNLQKRIKRKIGTEEILNLLFRSKNGK